jgi:hypothetical protein
VLFLLSDARFKLVDAPTELARHEKRDERQNKRNREKREYERDSPFHWRPV